MVSQPFTVPGTETDHALSLGMWLRPVRVTSSMAAEAGARPLAFSGDGPPLLGQPDEGEEVAPDARRHRLDHVEGGCGRDGCVDGVAARHHHPKPRHRSQRLASRDHPVLGVNR